MTMMPNQIFAAIDKDKELFQQIKARYAKDNKIEARLYFNYYFYDSIMRLHLNKNAKEQILKTIRYFCVKEDAVVSQMPPLNNTYQIAIMMGNDDLLSVLMGRASNTILLNSDAAKLGALIAYGYKIYNIGKTDILTETLFSSQNMI